MKDPNYVANMEKAISEKYGKEAIQNPKSFWNEKKEKEYLLQLKEEQSRNYEKKEKRVRKPIFSRECKVCSKSKVKKKHDIYFIKFDCCFDCYVQWVEHREERWKSGWRPNE